MLAALVDEAHLRVQVRRLLRALAPKVHLERLVWVDAGELGAGRVELEVLTGADADLTARGRTGEVREPIYVINDSDASCSIKKQER